MIKLQQNITKRKSLPEYKIRNYFHLLFKKYNQPKSTYSGKSEFMCFNEKIVNSHFALNIKLHDDCWGKLYPFCLWKSEHKFIDDMTVAGIHNSYNVLSCPYPPAQKR